MLVKCSLFFNLNRFDNFRECQWNECDRAGPARTLRDPGSEPYQSRSRGHRLHLPSPPASKRTNEYVY